MQGLGSMKTMDHKGLTEISSIDRFWKMSNIQIHSIQDPLNTPELARAAVTTLTRAEAMGLLPENETIDRLDLATLQKVAKTIVHAGIGHGFAVDLATAHSRDPKRLG
jgi:hypothetical protein